MDDDANKQKNVISFGLGELVRQTDGVLRLARLPIYCMKAIRILHTYLEWREVRTVRKKPKRGIALAVHRACSHQSGNPTHSLERSGATRVGALPESGKGPRENKNKNHLPSGGTPSILRVELSFSGPCHKTPTDGSIRRRVRKAMTRIARSGDSRKNGVEMAGSGQAPKPSPPRE